MSRGLAWSYLAWSYLAWSYLACRSPQKGRPSKVSEVLAPKRSLSKEMIRRLHDGLGIPLASLLTVRKSI